MGRVVTAVVAVAVLAGVVSPQAAVAAAPSGPPVDWPSVHVLTDLPVQARTFAAARARALAAAPAVSAEASMEEKVAALRALGVDVDNTWLVLGDRDFVFKVFDTVEEARFPLVKAGALQAFRDGAGASTVFIRSKIGELADRDRDAYARGKIERDQARRIKQTAAALVEMPVTPEKLDLSYRDFVFQLWRFVTDSPKVKSAALAAFGADEAGQKLFLASGLLAAIQQDQADAIAADAARTEAEKARAKARDTRRNAAAVVGLATADAVLDLADDFFIRKLLEKAVPGSQVALAAQAALNSSEPADWQSYLVTGIYAARDRDVQIENERKAAEDRRIAREVKTRAERGGMRPRLVAAAEKALSGSDLDVAKFLATGRYEVAEQSLGATTAASGTRGSYVASDGGNAYIVWGNAGTRGSAKIPHASWIVHDGLADADGFSLESADRPGYYLRTRGEQVALEPSDGSTGFKTDATWRSRPGKAGPGVSLESLAHPGEFLRHWGGQLYATAPADSGGFHARWLYDEDATWRVADPNPDVTTPVMARWYNDDAVRATLGDPVAGEVYEAAGAGVRYRDFARGRMYWSAATGAHAVTGPALEKYKTLAVHDWLMPVNDTTPTPAREGSYTHLKNNGSIYWSPATGARYVYGAIRQRWAEIGWENSYLGFPATDEEQAGTLRRTVFEHGNIDYDPATGRTRDYRT